jgi:hypothetical protein
MALASYDGSLKAIERRARRWWRKNCRRHPSRSDGPTNHTEFALWDRQRLIERIVVLQERLISLQRIQEEKIHE